MTTPDPFAPGYRLTDGNQLNYEVANPSWSVSDPVSATVGGTMLTSKKVTFTITNLTTVAAPGAGLTIPQALPGRVLVVNNTGANDVRIFAEGDSTINGLAGSIGVLVPKNNSAIFTALSPREWAWLAITPPPTFIPTYPTLVGFLYSDGVNPITGVSLIADTYLPLTIDQCRSSLLHFGGTSGVGTPTWLSIVEDDLAVNHNDSQDATAIRYWGAFWPPGGPAWTYVRTVLKAYFGWSDATADARILTAQTYAYTNR